MKLAPWTCRLAVTLAAALGGCGGGDDEDSGGVAARTQAQHALLDKALRAAQTDVTLARLPALHRCLAHIQDGLAPSGSTRPADLSCAAGTYRGTSSTAQPCTLTIAARGSGRVVFTHGTETVTIDQQITAQRPGEPAIYNISSASASPSRPGIALFRYEASPIAHTETLALTAGEPVNGPGSLPEVRYTRAKGQAIQHVLCRIGA